MTHYPRILIGLVTAIMPLLSAAEAPSQSHCSIDDSSITPIATIQGAGNDSPLVGDTITTLGIVSHNVAAEDQVGGVFIQSPPALQDDDPNTSEGIFVSAATNMLGHLEVNTLIKITGQVQERDQLTQLTEVSTIYQCDGEQSLTPASLKLPLNTFAQAEALENMLVTITATDPLTISGHYPLARYGSFDVSSGRLFTPTQIATPGTAAIAVAKANELNRLQIDDNSQLTPQSLPHQALFNGPQHSLRSGTTLKPITGVLTQFRQDYRIQPTSQLEMDKRSLITPIHPKQNDAAIRIASFNVLNYFNGDGQGNGFPTERGAASAKQLARQQTKIVAAITALDADIIGLMEVENDGYDKYSAITELTNAINQRSDIQYAVAQPHSSRIGADQISVAMLYNKQRFNVVNHALTHDSGPFKRGSRVPLAQVFKDTVSEQRLTVVVNHFKSKGGCPERGVNANQNDGQACWNALRVESAESLVAWIADQAFPQPVLVGDFNAYYKEDPIRWIGEHGYTNVSSASDYSYVYDSQAGSLDHIFVHQSLVPKLQQVQHINYNADEPIIYDYRDDSYYQPGPFRASDHDPLLVDLLLSSGN